LAPYFSNKTTPSQNSRYNIAMKPKNSGAFFFFLLGGVSILCQTVLLREITTLFYGNEIFYSLGLGMWLFFTGLGSLLALKIFKPSKHYFYFLILFGLASFLFALILLLRLIVAKFIPMGELPTLTFTLLTVFPTLFIFCLLMGAIFPLAVASFAKKKSSSFVNNAYFWETLGLAVGGFSFSLFLANSSFPLPPQLNISTLRSRYPQITTAVNSSYEQIIITQKDSQKNFFLNGRLAFQTQENLENKHLLSLIKPFVRSPQRILVIGSPTLPQTLQQEFLPQKVHFLEIDSRLLKLEKELFPNKVNFLTFDPRKFWQKTDELWGLIIVSLGNPQTLFSNRFFTQESFLSAKKHLSKEGILVLTIDLPTDYQSPEALNLGGLIYHTFKSVFPQMELLIKEDQLLFLGSRKKLTFDQTASPYFWHYFNSKQRQSLKEKLTSVPKKLNTDLEPRAFFAQQVFWQTILSFQSAKFLSLTTKVIPFLLLIFFLVLLKSKGDLHLGILMATSSFSLISLETIIIFLFQIQTGYLYRQISLLFALFLVGMATGVRLSPKVEQEENLRRTVLILSLIIAILGLILKLNIFLGPFLLFLANFSAGFFGGRIFHSLNQLYLKGRQHPGFIYAFDLFGSSLGALLTGSLLLPVLGIENLIWVLSGLTLINFFSSPNAGN